MLNVQPSTIYIYPPTPLAAIMNPAAGILPGETGGIPNWLPPVGGSMPGFGGCTYGSGSCGGPGSVIFSDLDVANAGTSSDNGPFVTPWEDRIQVETDLFCVATPCLQPQQNEMGSQMSKLMRAWHPIEAASADVFVTAGGVPAVGGLAVAGVASAGLCTLGPLGCIAGGTGAVASFASAYIVSRALYEFWKHGGVPLGE